MWYYTGAIYDVKLTYYIWHFSLFFFLSYIKVRGLDAHSDKAELRKLQRLKDEIGDLKLADAKRYRQLRAQAEKEVGTINFFLMIMTIIICSFIQRCIMHVIQYQSFFLICSLVLLLSSCYSLSSSCYSFSFSSSFLLFFYCLLLFFFYLTGATSSRCDLYYMCGCGWPSIS